LPLISSGGNEVAKFEYQTQAIRAWPTKDMKATRLKKEKPKACRGSAISKKGVIYLALERR
jgi:hypothetical protein